MEKKLETIFAIGLFVFGLTGAAHATLTTIGTAIYNGSDYKLIWDDNNNGNSLVWLDYWGGPEFWAFQNARAAGLDSVLTLNLDTGYNITWDEAA